MIEINDNFFIARTEAFDYGFGAGYSIGERMRDNPVISGFPTKALAKQGLNRLRERLANGETALTIDVSNWRLFVVLEV